jgi:hypothetical protein
MDKQLSLMWLTLCIFFASLQAKVLIGTEELATTTSFQVSFLSEAVGSEEARAYKDVKTFPIAFDLDPVIVEETALASSSSSSCICIFGLVRTTAMTTGARCLARRPDNFRTVEAL